MCKNNLFQFCGIKNLLLLLVVILYIFANFIYFQLKTININEFGGKVNFPPQKKQNFMSQNPLFIKYIFTVFKKILHNEYIVKVTASKQVCSQWNIAKWRNEHKKRLRISDTQFVRNGIIITKWRNEHKKRLRISDTQFVRNGIIITKWRNEQIKRPRISDTQLFTL